MNGGHRREKLVYPYEALREALFNCVIHREYFVSSEIQIWVYEDKLVIRVGSDKTGFWQIVENG